MPSYDNKEVTIFPKQSSKMDGNPIENKTAEKVIHQSDFPAKVVPERAIAGNLLQIGLASELPDGSTWTKMFFEKDTKKLKIWNETDQEWDEVQLS